MLAVLSGSVALVHADESAVAQAPSGLTALLQAQRPSGTLRMDYFRSSNTLDNGTDFLGATAQIKVLPELSSSIDAKLEARITNASPGNGGETQSRLLEGYATAHFEKADLRIGKQIVAWGRADGINPTDNLTPRDFVVLLPFEDDQRFGTTAIKFDTYLSPQHTLSVFVTPWFEPSKMPLPTTATIKQQIPARTLSHSEVGIKLDKAGEGFDASVSYFRGFSLLPDLGVIASVSSAPLLTLHYDRITVFGADFARNFGRFGFRGELAYVDSADQRGTDPATKNPFLFWIIGLDRTFFANLNVNLQFFERRVRQYHTPDAIVDPVERGIAIQNAILDGQRDRLSHGISFRISDKWFNDTLEAELFAVFNLTRHDSFIRPLLTYAFSDHWKGTLGAALYNGAADTQYGSLGANRGAFAELRYGF
ncbi:MAG: hypothetical protein HY080_08395 [Gammaproteobacteria bacterium]|nr:hypothetical protein [Gammaproteobacteria bacterium]